MILLVSQSNWKHAIKFFNRLSKHRKMSIFNDLSSMIQEKPVKGLVIRNAWSFISIFYLPLHWSWIEKTSEFERQSRMLTLLVQFLFPLRRWLAWSPSLQKLSSEASDPVSLKTPFTLRNPSILCNSPLVFRTVLSQSLILFQHLLVIQSLKSYALHLLSLRH